MDGSRPSPLGHNRSLGQLKGDADKAVADAKNRAKRLRREADAKYDLAYLAASGQVKEREAKARQDRAYILADQAAFEAECAYEVAKAEASAAESEFEEWRTAEATKREEMKLR